MTATPLKFDVGVKMIWLLASTVAVPFVTPLTVTAFGVTGSLSGSASFASTSMATEPSSSIVTVSSPATGGTLRTVIVKEEVAVPPTPSSAVIVTA
jgi:hypothetical protein